MTLTEILKNRRSVRRFEPRPVPRETIEELLALALTAPSSKNTRSTRFMVVDEPEMLVRIAAMRDFGSALLAQAPCAVLVAGDTSATDLWLDNAAISATILQLAATDAGLGSCWVHVNGRPRWSEGRQQAGDNDNREQIADAQANPDETATYYLREFLPIPSDWNPLCFIALGYPAAAHKPHGEKDDADKIVWL